MKELDAFARILKDPARPFVAIVGGAKVSDKIVVLERLVEKVDALAHRRRHGLHVPQRARSRRPGASQVDTERIPVARRLLKRAEERGVAVRLPSDHVCARQISATAEREDGDRRGPGRMDGPRHRPRDGRGLPQAIADGAHDPVERADGRVRARSRSPPARARSPRRAPRRRR